jgi:imidazolonepropionase-like amidohydrolase
MAELVMAGLSPYEVLRAATANGGEFLGASPCRGRIERGCRADLVLLEANPLRDIANTRRIAGVVLNGRWVVPGVRAGDGRAGGRELLH